MTSFSELLRRDEDARATKGPGDLELGGFWDEPHLAMSYAHAAQVLRGVVGARTENVVAPMVFCVRHAVELALKDLLIAYQQNELVQREIDDYDGATTSAAPMPDPLPQQIATSHDLGKLLAWVEQWLPEYLTPEWRALVTALEKCEQSHVDRFRYSTIGPVVGRSGRRSSPSFTPLIVIPVDTLFELLDRFMQEAALIVPLSELKDATNWSALQDLAMTGMSLDQELHTRGLL